MTHRLIGKLLVGVWALTIVLGGCAGKAVKPSDEASRSVGTTSAGLSQTSRIVATAQIDLTTVKGRYPMRAAVIIQQPAFLRLEALPVIGTPDFFLAATPDDFRVYIPASQEFYTGKPTAENLARFSGWDMDIKDIVRILSGACPDLDGRHEVLVSPTGDGLVRVDMKSTVGPSQTVWMEKNDRMVKLLRWGADGKETYSVLYENYTAGNPLPGKITILWADGVGSVTVRYEHWKIESAADRSVFDLPMPADAKLIRLD